MKGKIMNTEQIAELREHLQELHGLLECETHLHGGATLTAHNLRVSILNIENELAGIPCPACGQTDDALDRRTVAAFSTVTVCHVCCKVIR